MSSKKLEVQPACWVQRLQEHIFTSEHRQGRKQNNAEPLSRLPCQEGLPTATQSRPGRRQAGTSHYDCSSSRWNPAALVTEQVNDKEVETGQRPKWKDIADRSLTHKSYWAQRKSHAVRNGILERNWESVDGRSKIAQIVLPRSRMNEVLSELHRGPSGGHLGVKKTLNKFRQRYYWLQA
jgi:hypothetical protein